jgi:glycosyltransferase involved in cell wall biosynthesis
VQIDHITFSNTGGAGLVTQTLAKAQMNLGHDVKVMTVIDSDLWSKPFQKPALTLAAAADEYLVSSGSEKTLFSLFRANLETLDGGGIRPGSIIHLHWVSGVLNQNSIQFLMDSGRKVVWTLHDMNPFTGGCHHSHSCQQFFTDCSSCPQAQPAYRRAVSINLRKKQLTKKYSNLRIVSPTSWMLERVTKSSVFRDQDCSEIPNPIDVAFFSQPNKLAARDQLGLSITDFVAVVIAKDLQDPNKNVGFALKALEQVAADVKVPLTLLLIGKNGASYSSSMLKVHWAGELDAVDASKVASAADCLLSSSIAESAGMTIVECAAMGIPAVALENGGTASLVENSVTGFLAKDLDSFATGVMTLATDKVLLKRLGNAAQQMSVRHKPDLISARYVDLYRSIK